MARPAQERVETGSPLSLNDSYEEKFVVLAYAAHVLSNLIACSIFLANVIV